MRIDNTSIMMHFLSNSCGPICRKRQKKVLANRYLYLATSPRLLLLSLLVFAPFHFSHLTTGPRMKKDNIDHKFEFDWTLEKRLYTITSIESVISGAGHHFDVRVFEEVGREIALGVVVVVVWSMFL